MINNIQIIVINCNFVPLFIDGRKIMDEYIIADNQDISKAGIMFLLSNQKDGLSLFEAVNKAELIHQLQLHPSAVVVLDYTLFDFADVSELIALHERFMNSRWLLFSDELTKEFLRRILYCPNVFSVAMKDNTQEEILSAILAVCRGQRYISSDVSNLLLDNTVHVSLSLGDHLLTNTEKAILKEIAFGKTTKEIATERNISFHTVNSHRKNIFRKLEVNNVQEAIKYAVRAGIVDLAEYFI